MAVLKPFQLLEINIISAQDLEPLSKKMKTYASAWVNPSRKLTTRVDPEGSNNPTWNDKFVFRVDEDFLRRDTSAVMIELYAVHWFRDTLVGTVRVLVGNLIPPPTRPHHHHRHIGMRFVALQVRRPSGRPQGILNIGVALLDSSMRSMPLYTQLSASAVGYRDLMGEEDPHQLHHHNNHQNYQRTTNAQASVKPILRRSRSERSERVTLDNISVTNSSLVGIPQNKGDSSILSISEYAPEPVKNGNKKGKASSVISGAELRVKKDKKGKASSVISDSLVSRSSTKEEGKVGKLLPLPPATLNNKSSPSKKVESELSINQTSKVVDEKLVTKNTVSPPTEASKATIGKPISKYTGNEYGGAMKGSLVNGKFVFGPKANSLWSDSEVGPSPSEVAAAMVEKRYPLDEERSSVLDGWSLDESVEGLRSKLERWRTEVPPLYDRGFSSSTFQSTSHHTRRHSDGGSGLFSCFGNIFGYECQCICGKPSERKGLRFHSPSIGSTGRSFI